MATIVIAGASLAGGRAAETLRAEGFDGRVVLVGEEPERPYERPPLSKQYLAGHQPRERLFLRPAEYYAEQQIELQLGRRVELVRVAEQQVVLADGEAIAYDQLLIATGCTPRRLSVPGHDLERVCVLRSLADADAIRAVLQPGARVVVVGFGFIGAEVAATCRQVGASVTAIEPLAAPLARVFDPAIGQHLAALHRAHGVQLRLGEGVSALRGHRVVEEVVTTSGAVIPCDLVVVGIGVRPADEWLAGSGIARQDGVLVDETCRTNLPGIFAAGDVASWWSPSLSQYLRVEHFDHAQQHGVHAARAMLGYREAYDPLLFFWSDQYDLNIQYLGLHQPGDRLVWRGNPPEPPWAVFFLRDGRVAAALTVNLPREAGAARQLIRKGVVVPEAALQDPATDLRQLARSL
ncbi:MAG: FAD-dependent oxidoreductase [Chloroflexi bacterium]|nr:FAD-dependent oxidoreductase [Chloroflexota bacterium]